jgi:hypothetical protein
MDEKSWKEVLRGLIRVADDTNDIVESLNEFRRLPVDNDMVAAIWPDPSEKDGLAFLLLKGGPDDEQLPLKRGKLRPEEVAARARETRRMAAINCNDHNQAIALRAYSYLLFHPPPPALED